MDEYPEPNPFPDGSDVLVLYPAGHVDGTPCPPREEWAWLSGRIEQRCGPDEWQVAVLDRRAAQLESGVPAPPDTGDLLLYHPLCFRDATELRLLADVGTIVGTIAGDPVPTSGPPATRPPASQPPEHGLAADRADDGAHVGQEPEPAALGTTDPTSPAPAGTDEHSGQQLGNVHGCAVDHFSSQALEHDCESRLSWVTCLQAMAQGWIQLDDLCPRCMFRLMMALELTLEDKETLAWQQRWLDRVRAEAAADHRGESTPD